jgi:hypothetical protein
MSIRYLFLCCAFTSSTIVVFAQTLSVNLGTVIDKKTVRDNFDAETLEGALYQLIGLSTTSHNNLFDTKSQRSYMGSATTGDKFYQIGILDNYVNLNNVKRLAAEFVDDPNERISVEAFLSTENKNYALYSVERAAQNEVTVYVNELNDEMVLMGSPIKIATFKEVKKYGTDIFVIASQENTSFLIARSQNTKGKEKQTLECLVVNSQFSTKWSKIISLSQRDKDVTLSDINIDDNGNVYILGIQHPGMYKNVPAIYTYLWEHETYREEIIGKPGYEVFGAKLFVIKGKKPMVAGMYTKSGVSGFFINSINMSTATLDELISMEADKEAKEMLPKYPNRGSNYAVENLIQLSSGDYVLSIENHVNSIWVVSFNDKKDLVWSNIVHKSQIGSQTYSADGHTLLGSGNNTFVIYNDHPNNLKKSITAKDLTNYTSISGQVVVQQFDELGKGKKYALVKGNDGENLNLKMRQVYRITDSLYQVKLTYRSFTSQDAKYRYATLELK